MRNNRLFFFLAIIVIGIRLLFSWLDMSFIMSRVVDDAFYYFKTAQNIATDGRSTFDGINLTNGYHPLWMLCLLPIFYLVRGNNELSINLVMTLQTGILAAIIFLFGKILKNKFGPSYATLGLCIFMWPRFLSQTEYGLEAGLLILLILISVQYCLAKGVFTSEGDKNSSLILGIILTSVFLARLDSIFYLMPVFIYLVFNSLKNRKRLLIQERLINLLYVSIPVCLIPLPYLAWNYFVFGHLTPISGSLKHSFPKVMPNFHYFVEFREFALIFVLALIFLVASVIKNASLRKLIPDKNYMAVLIILASYVVIHFTDTIFFMKWAVFRWHFAGYTVFLILVSPLIAALIKSAIKRISGLEISSAVKTIFLYSLIVAALFFQGLSIKRSLINKFQYECYKEALWMKENTPRDATFMLEDAGIIAFFSERRVINIDGVINNFELQEYLKKGRLLDYIKDKNITYFIHHSFWSSPDVRKGNYENYTFLAYSHLYDCPGGTITLRKSDEIYHSQEYEHFGEKTACLIWKINNRS